MAQEWWREGPLDQAPMDPCVLPVARRGGNFSCRRI